MRKQIETIVVLLALLSLATLFTSNRVEAQEADLLPCPPVVDLPTAATVAGFRACGEEELAAASERRIRMLRGLAEETVVAVPVAVVPPVAAPVPPPVVDAERAALAARVEELAAELRTLREERAAEPPVVESVVAPIPEPETATETERPRLPYIGEASASMSGGGGVPMVTALPGFLHRRPVPWSPRRGLRLWNGLNCDGEFAFAIEVRVDGRVVIPTEMGAAWPAIPVVDSAGRRSSAYLVPQGRDRRSGGYVYIPVGGGDHDVEVTMYDAPLGMTPMRIGGGRFRFNPSTAGDLHQLRWYEVSGRDGGFCGSR